MQGEFEQALKIGMAEVNYESHIQKKKTHQEILEEMEEVCQQISDCFGEDGSAILDQWAASVEERGWRIVISGHKTRWDIELFKIRTSIMGYPITIWNIDFECTVNNINEFRERLKEILRNSLHVAEAGYLVKHGDGEMVS